MANEKLRYLIADVNPKEIASHIESGNLHKWCNRWRDAAFSCLGKESAVEVVRCKDCKKAKEATLCDFICTRDEVMIPMNANDFCSYGERREGE